MCIAEHAERNCIANAARHGVCTKDAHMYLTCEIPCSNCLSLLINAGVTDITVTKLNYYDQTGEYLIKNSNLTVSDYNCSGAIRGERVF
jgi:deoxycytidylate deaminase